jgi:hypothetical protein
MHLVREVTSRDYRAIYEEFDQVARFAELTPADRHMFWVEQCQAGFPSLAAAKALGHPIDTEPWREWPVPIHAFLGDPYYVGTNVVVRPAVGEFLGDFFDEGAGRSARPGLPRRWHQPHVPRRGCGLAAARTHPRRASGRASRRCIP